MKWIKPFLIGAGGILLMAALTRFLIAAGNVPALSLPEPLLGVPLRYAVIAVGVIELAAALVCLFVPRVGLRVASLAGVMTVFLGFWLVLVWRQCQPQGACIGSLTDPLRIYRGTTGQVLEFIPFCLVLGSYAALAWLAIGRLSERSRQLARASLKISCPACGGHITFAAGNLGQTVPCPRCKAMIVLKEPENLKMTCVLCGGHVEFPPHAIGQKIPCPHCAKTITLLKPA